MRPGHSASGANMAFRTSALRAVGGFDPALGAGSPGIGGDDLAAFFQIIMAGHTLVYEPGAIVASPPSPRLCGLRKQVHGYGVGLTAYLTKCLIDRPVCSLTFTTWIPLRLAFALSARSAKNAWKGPKTYPARIEDNRAKRDALWPVRLLRGRWQTRHLRKPTSLAVMWWSHVSGRRDGAGEGGEIMIRPVPILLYHSISTDTAPKFRTWSRTPGNVRHAHGLPTGSPIHADDRYTIRGGDRGLPRTFSWSAGGHHL